MHELKGHLQIHDQPLNAKICRRERVYQKTKVEKEQTGNVAGSLQKPLVTRYNM